LHKLLEVLKKRKPLLDEASTVLSVLGAPYLSTPTTPFYAVAATALSAAVSASAEYSASQSQVPVFRTNVQVEGVDEPDIVKNSDRFIAVAVGERIYIVNAASNRVASTLNLTSIASSSASKPLHLYAQGMLHTATGLAIIASPGAVVLEMVRRRLSRAGEAKREAVKGTEELVELRKPRRRGGVGGEGVMYRRLDEFMKKSGGEGGK